MQEDKYDSTKDTLLHIRRVNELVNDCAINLIKRAVKHDHTKIEEPEKSGFDLLTPEFRKLKYGSEEYYAYINRPEVVIAINHHHKAHSHHPEHHALGVTNMSLMDMIEMLCDWKAACERNPNGVFFDHLKYNFNRYKMQFELRCALLNTAEELGFIPK